MNPKDERLWTVLAETQIRNKLLSEATISLAKAKKINPKNAKLWFAEGSIQLEQRNTRKAILLTKRGLLIEPDNAYAYFQIGNARIMQSNPYYALKAFKKASRLQPTLWQAFNNQGLVLFEMGKRKEAIKVWQEVLKLNEHPETMLALAAALKQSEKTTQEALDYAKKALAQDPNYISPQHQKEQLWGIKLQEATKELFKDPKLKYDVERALENSN